MARYLGEHTISFC